MMTSRILTVMVARNEEQHLLQSLRSLFEQALPPFHVIVVDDRSVDGTATVAEEYARTNPAVRLVGRTGISKAEHEAEIPKAFNEGLKASTDPWDFLAKIDADIVLESSYFQTIIEAFASDPHLGIAGGQTINEPSIEVRGGNRVIRRECWEEISSGGLMPVTDAEDSYLDLKARYRGWRVQLIPEARSLHLRPTRNWPTAKILKQRWRIGVTSYRFGYHPLLFAGRMFRVAFFERPKLVTFIPMSLGWVYAFLTRNKIDKELRQYQRSLQGFRVRNALHELARSPLKAINRIRRANL